MDGALCFERPHTRCAQPPTPLRQLPTHRENWRVARDGSGEIWGWGLCFRGWGAAFSVKVFMGYWTVRGPWALTCDEQCCTLLRLLAEPCSLRTGYDNQLLQL